jgi:hypothetical protein
MRMIRTVLSNIHSATGQVFFGHPIPVVCVMVTQVLLLKVVVGGGTVIVVIDEEVVDAQLAAYCVL